MPKLRSSECKVHCRCDCILVDLCPFGPFVCMHTAPTETLNELSQDVTLQNFIENCQDISVLDKTVKGTGHLT